MLAMITARPVQSKTCSFKWNLSGDVTIDRKFQKSAHDAEVEMQEVFEISLKRFQMLSCSRELQS